jgi:hypothetical protein
MTMTTPKKKMVALKVLETSGVDHPAHMEEGWIVMKSADGNEVVMDEDEVVMDASLEDAYVERVIELEKALADRDEEIAVLKKMTVEVEEEDMEEDDMEEDEGMMKSVPQPVREMLAKARAEADSVREELRKEREDRRNTEYVAKAAEWTNLTVDPDEFGVALRKMADIAPDLAEQVEKALDAANAQAEAGAIFSEIGRTASYEDSNAYAKVETMAKAAVKSGEFSTIEQAIAGIVQKNPDLYAAYRNENLR